MNPKADSSSSVLQTFKIVFLGDCAVGKTCIVLRFAKDSFQENYVLTIGLNYEVKKMTLANNETIKVQIWDTSGEEKFRTVNSLFYKGAKIVLFVYSIVDRKSFDELSKYWMNTIETSLSDPSKDFILCFSNGCCRK